MAQLLNGGFDATQFAPNQLGSSGLPVGKHEVIIDSSEVKPNNAGTGGYLQLNLKVVSGESAGATGVARLNLYAASQKACEIAHGQMSALCHCLGVFQVPDSQVLHNIPFMVEVGSQALTEQQLEQKAQGVSVTPYTEVKKFLDRNGNEPGKAPANNNGGAGQNQQPNNFQQNGQNQQQPNNQQQQSNFQQQPQNNQPQNNNFQQSEQQQSNNGGGNFNQQQPNNQQQSNGNFNQQPQQNQNQQPQNNNFQQQQPQGGNFNQQQQPQNNGGGGSNVPWGSK